MKTREMYSLLDGIFPFQRQASWDRSGWQIVHDQEEITGVFLALDAEMPILQQMQQEGCNLLITHHPLLFRPISSLREGVFPYPEIAFCLSNRLSLLALHTNFDQGDAGMNCSPIRDLFLGIPQYLAEEGELSYGTIGEVPLQRVGDLVRTIEERFGTSGRLFGDPQGAVSRLAYIGGDGGDFVEEAIRKNAELFVTGDIRYHNVQMARRAGMHILDIGHAASEMHFVDRMREILEHLLAQKNIPMHISRWTHYETSAI